MSTKIREYLLKRLGKQLRVVIGSYFFMDGVFDPNPMHVWLHFMEHEAIRISGASDGEGLLIDTDMPSPASMGKYGEIVVRSMSENPYFGPCLHRSLLEASAIESPHGNIIGVRFDFGENQKPMILNWGDELVVAHDYPADAVKENILEIRF